MKFFRKERPSDPAEKVRLRSLDRITFHNFSFWEKIDITTALKYSGIPLNNLAHMRKDMLLFTEKNPQHPVAEYERAYKTVNFYSAFADKPEHEKGAVIIHELAHSVSPFFPENAPLYGSEEKRFQAEEYIQQVSIQCATAGFINPYQSELSDLLREESFSGFQTFTEETQAILIESRFMYPELLRATQRIQRRSLEKQKRVESFVPLITENSEQAVGIDALLLAYMPPHVRTLQDLDKHITRYRKWFD
ncbi:hypothetical protein A2841_02945 [Candidatus Kaiserbacteria bacterium RIFCSPHIGHO2_01_FULL_48_10]|uniref:Uncharacterized protein n=1 Tax=Candidatus Kaiserbacteria bacterium RIFCSPHIGHO2_01_FULL_48_10 TaxID=1798476 RepID=A0A1F6C164_9BACT|nr:MAG: hypothetical protein A2841_02945 [Candidatus Kaiserbacteria bacterium RIFCSPHIGHO2_01_FULL_48_10]